MKNKKFLGITAALAVTVLTGSSLAIFAAETAVSDADYSYHVGQQRAAQYAQDGDDDEEYKAGYSYSVGRQNYMEKYGKLSELLKINKT